MSTPDDGTETRPRWVFGYGSLMWNPGFATPETRAARLQGWHRAFCIYSEHYRGTPQQPGLILGLLPGGACRGLAHRLPDEDVIAMLTQVKGIGRWTAEMYLMFHLQRPDVLPLGDLGVATGFAKVYNGGVRVSPDVIAAHAEEKWRPFRSVGSWYMWRALEG